MLSMQLVEVQVLITELIMDHEGVEEQKLLVVLKQEQFIEKQQQTQLV